MKKISILGSTGSVGTQCLDIISEFEDQFEVISLTAGKNEKKLKDQLRKFKPKYYLSESEVIYEQGKRLKNFEELLQFDDSDLIVIALSGISGLLPVLISVEQGRNIALANKESLVACGDLLNEISKKNKSSIIPLDSEHSAIWQCLKDEDLNSIDSIALTASGGSLRDIPYNKLSKITPSQVLNHPTWSMGDKITVDSATLINKVFEVQEASNLFEIPLDKINVVFHNESIIHGMVNYVDGNTISIMSKPDMKIPILYALFYPNRAKSKIVERINFNKIKNLTFRDYEEKKLSFFNFGMNVIKSSKLGPSFLVGSDQAVVENFLKNKINYLGMLDIMKEVYKYMDLSKPYSIESSKEVIKDSFNLTNKLINDGNI
jgi:1-deoxy-D-xylulose-5-phosphate reductoisomerase